MPSWMRRLLSFLIWSYVTYLALSLFVVLPALNIAAPWAVREFAHRELRHEILLFNPFKLSVELRQATVQEPDGHVPLGLKLAELNLSIASLWQEGIVLDAVRVEELDLHVLRYADGTFHFRDLLSDTPPENDSDGTLPGLTIKEIYLSAHTLRFTDRTRPGPYTAAYRDFEVRKRDLTTLPQSEGRGEMTIVGADGGIISWRGELHLAEGISRGNLSIDNLDLTHLWRYERDNLEFTTRSALLDVGLRYEVNWSEELAFRIGDGRLQLHEVSLRPAEEAALPDTGIDLRDLSVTGIAVDGSAQSVAIDRLAVDGLTVDGFDRDGQISLLRMFLGDSTAMDSGENEATGPEAKQGVEEDAEELAWRVALAEFALDGSAVHWHSDQLQPELLTVSPLSLRAADLHWPAEGPSDLGLSLALNDVSRLSVSGQLNLKDGRGGLDYDLQTLPLAWFNPLINQSLLADISSGALTLTGQVALEDFAPSTVDSDLGLADFAMQIHGARDSALELKELAVTGLSVAPGPQTLRIADVRLQSPRAGLNILEDGTLNITRAMVESAEAQNGAGTPAPGGEGTADAGQEDDDTGDDEWAIRLDHLGIRDGRLDFSDDSLPLPFRTLIGDIEADLNDLDSESEDPGVVTLNGAVDGYAPVIIEARGRPLSKRDGELRFSFRGMDIATMSPYSGTYAGYSIDSGSLSVDLDYRFDGPSLAGDNRIIISQMELGEPIDSDKAMQLPLQLGIALLTDAEGVIDLAVPISGNVDDPQFSLGGVIARAIGNVIIKAATAPFRFLASLVDSDEDLENIAFNAGSAEVTAEALASLKTLASALDQRPKLQLRILGGVDPVADRRALRREAFDKSLAESGVSPEAIAAGDDVYVAAVQSRYQALALPAPEDGSTPTLEDQLQALLATVTLPQTALRDLATRRATAAKRTLVNEAGVDAGRVAVSYDSGLLSAGIKMALSG